MGEGLLDLGCGVPYVYAFFLKGTIIGNTSLYFFLPGYLKAQLEGLDFFFFFGGGGWASDVNPRPD